jgi:thiol-disulfide isomerase/thioredoxin
MDSIPPPDHVPPEPAVAPPIPVAAQPVAVRAPGRRFSWRDFLLGIAAGLVLAIGGIVLLFVGLVMFAANLAEREGTTLDTALSAPRLPAADRMTAYGQADMDWTFQTMAGERASLADYRGKVIFLNVWATWCGPCLAEMPSLERLHTSVTGDQVAFLFVSEEDTSKIKPFVEKKGWKLPIFRAPALPDGFQTSGIPATFIIDRSGTVVVRHVGAADWGNPATVTFLQTLADSSRGRIEK